MIARAQTRPRPVFCVVEHAYRDRDVADEVCEGRFTHAGITLDLGLEPDWLTDGLRTRDEEWRIEWSKFYYGLDLAYAFCETGDTKYLRAWERLLCSWMRQVPVGFDPSDVTGRRILNWIYAWNAFASSNEFQGLRGDLDEQIVASLASQVRHLRSHLTPERNHRTLELYALFVAALALPELDTKGDLLDFAIRELHQNLLTDVRPDGVHRESSTHYHMTALRSYLAARENARRFHLEFPEGYDERLERACEFALHCHRPDGLIPALSDGDEGSYTDLLELAASLLGRPDFLYAATSGACGTQPRQRYMSFPEGGYYIQRSGWGDGREIYRQERFLILDCGPLGDGGHGHYDLLNLEAYAKGRPLVVDPGRYTYSEEQPNWRRWFKGTAAHNTVSVDGMDQTPYRNGKPKGGVAQGRLIERLTAPGFDMLSGEARTNAYDAVHTRRVFFIADEYWLVVDQLRSTRTHRFDLRFHLSPEALNQTSLLRREENTVAHAPGFALVFDGAHEAQLEEGWVAPKYGTKLAAPVVRVTSCGAARADFFTLIFPLDSDRQPPKLRLYAENNSSSEAMVAEVSGGGAGGSCVDRVVWNATHERYRLGPFLFRAGAAWLRERAGGEPLAFRCCGAQLSISGTNFSAGEHPSKWVAWDAQTSGVQCCAGGEP
ncbi:MAG: heparinase II/III family protein [Acidobacteriota bacterium]|nr:heparinase II/III family protein [Acidobacteriota bacterium]